MGKWFWGLLLVGFSHVSIASPQLNTGGFAYCLTQARPGIGPAQLELMRRWHGMKPLDGFLIFLSVYPGVRLPESNYYLQQPAQWWWSDRWNRNEADLSQRLLARAEQNETIVPATLFSDALASCGRRDAFCASLLSHNVLRTLGRNDRGTYVDPLSGEETNFNPTWFQKEENEWRENIPRIQRAMVPLRRDAQGDRWGEWYHFFGIFAYALHESAIAMPVDTVTAAVRMNKILNPILAGGPEEKEKAQLDRDSAEVARLYLSRQGTPAEDCSRAVAYVAAQ